MSRVRTTYRGHIEREEPDPPSGDALFSDGFESGDMSYNDGGFSWASGSMSPDTEQAYSGLYALEFNWGPNAPGVDAWQEQRFDLGQVFGELWIEYYVYLPSNFKVRVSEGYSENKFFFMWDDGDYPGGSPGQIQFNVNMATGTSDTNVNLRWLWGDEDYSYGGGTFGDFFSSADYGAWHRVRMHFRAGSYDSGDPALGDGLLEFWWDAARVWSTTRRWWHDNAAKRGVRKGYLWGYANSGFADLTKTYIDDIKFFNTDPGW